MKTIRVAFTVNVRIAQSLMALYELLTAEIVPETLTLDDPEFGTDPGEWPELLACWIETLQDRIPEEYPPEWQENDQRFVTALLLSVKERYSNKGLEAQG